MRQFDSATLAILSSYKMGICEQEEILYTPANQNKYIIGVVKEHSNHEKRVPLTPNGVEILVSKGFKIVIEKGVGKAAGFSDMEYVDSGAIVANTAEEVYKSDIILKMNHPQVHETNMMSEGKVVISNLHRGKPTADTIKALINRRITAIATEHITGQSGYPIRNIMFPIEANAIILLAAELLTNTHGGQGILLGGIAAIPPVEIVIIGASTFAEHAAKVAIALGASVKVFSSSLEALYRLKNNVGQALCTCIAQPKAMLKAFSSADVIINTFYCEEDDHLSFNFSEGMIEVMKKGAVVLDMSANTEDFLHYYNNKQPFNDAIFEKYGVIYHSTLNISSRVARTTSLALSNIAAIIVMRIGDAPNLARLFRDDKELRNGVYTFNGILTNAWLGRKYNLPYQDIDLLMASF